MIAIDIFTTEQVVAGATPFQPQRRRLQVIERFSSVNIVITQTNQIIHG